MIEIKIVKPVQEPEQDKRYRVMVLLHRSDRPRYWTFFCPACQKVLCEIVNSDVVAISDTMDMQNTSIYGPGIRCDGRYQGGHCGTYYYFVLGK